MPTRLTRPARVGTGVAAVAASAGLMMGAAAPASAAPATPPSALLNIGTRGPSVTDVQHALHIHANGQYTPRTERAVVAFQRRDGLQTDGIVGPQTWAALFHESELAATPASGSEVGAGASGTSGTASSSPSGASAAQGSGGYTIPTSIVECESHGDYSAVNPETGAGGAYQIEPGTWQAYGGQGAPQDASPAEQGAIAAKIYASQGSSAWTCG